jgi:hypothetical protein
MNQVNESASTTMRSTRPGRALARHAFTAIVTLAAAITGALAVSGCKTDPYGGCAVEDECGRPVRESAGPKCVVVVAATSACPPGVTKLPVTAVSAK